MKKFLCVILLIAEAAVGFLALELVWKVTYIPCVITIAVWALLLIMQLVALKRADAVSKRKIYRRIALVMLIPLLGFLVMLIWFVLGFIIVT